MTEKLNVFAGIALVLFNRALRTAGLRPPIDGWRRGAGLVLRGDTAKFVLSAFSLDVLSDQANPSGWAIGQIQQHLAERLATFLQAESAFHLVVRHEADADTVISYPSPSYTLAFEPATDGPTRFIRPDQWAGDSRTFAVTGASPVFQFVGRVGSDGSADLWVRVNHVATDGVPAQEMLSRLELAWGMKSPIVFPGRDEFEPHTAARPSPGRPGTVEVQLFVDFGRLLVWRKRQNEKLAEPMTFSAAMLWWLAHHDVFRQLHLGTTVEIPVVDGLGRGVGVVVVRPADYFDQSDGLVRYVEQFNRQLTLTRERKSEGCRTLDAAAYLPAKLEESLLRHALDGGIAFGSTALTVLKDAKVFGAPLGDTGHVNGFIAVGGVSYESSDGKRVGCVVVKGPADKISNYAQVIHDAMNQISDA